MPKSTASDKFQGLCLQAMNGCQTISSFDGLPSEIREIVRNSSFNLCPACLLDMAGGQKGDIRSAIGQMEHLIRCEEIKNEPNTEGIR